MSTKPKWTYADVIESVIGAFLGWTQLDRLQRQFGSKLRIEMKPFLLGILFRECAVLCILFTRTVLI